MEGMNEYCTDRHFVDYLYVGKLAMLAALVFNDCCIKKNLHVQVFKV